MGGDHTTSVGFAKPVPRETRAGDALPTRAVIDWVKSEAWRRASLKAIGLGWPVGEAGIGVMRLAPAVAYDALTRLCPQVNIHHCARVLGLDLHEVNELGNRALSLGPWAGEQATEIFDLLRNGPPQAAEGEG